jgi:hypothetical protein
MVQRGKTNSRNGIRKEECSIPRRDLLISVKTKISALSLDKANYNTFLSWNRDGKAGAFIDFTLYG